ncbi:MAG: protein kinase [Acidobacteriota bacterium]
MDPGSRLGPYEILGKLGEGGMGAVYLADDPRLERRVALKVLVDRHPGAGADLDSLVREARMASALRHPNICAIYDIGVDSDPPYIAMELVEGKPLNRLVRDGAAPVERVIRFGVEIAGALAHAHDRGIIHRDLKAANVMLDADGSCKVLDFGLAHSSIAAEEQTAEITRTASAEIAGTLAYMAPELLRGAAADERSDIWALGIILYELAAGRRPFAGGTPFELTSAIINGMPAALPAHVPPGLAATISRSLANDRQRRYGTAGEVRAALEALLPGTVTAATSAPAPQESRPAAVPGESATSADSAPRRVATPTTAPRIAGTAAAPPPAPRTAERRRVTMALCTCEVSANDGDGFVDPEDHAEIIEAFRATCAEAIDRYGGMMLPSADQRVTCCFGYPTAFEDAAQRAVHAALHIVGASRAGSARGSASGATLTASIAVDTGLALVGGEDPYRIVGDISETLTRLSVTQEPGSLVITEATRRAVAGFFEVEDLGTPAVPGWQRGPLFRALRATGARSRLDVTDEAHLTPLIGRDQEMGLLLDKWERARDGMGQVVQLVGEAGIGKSRLVGLMLRRAAEGRAGESSPVVQWRCSPYHRTSSLHPAVEFFTRHLGFAPDEGPAARAVKLEEHLGALDLDPARFMPLLLALLSLPADERYPLAQMTPRKQKDQTLEALIDWLYAHARREPLLFVVEDVHWMDPSTLAFLDLLMSEGTAEAILVLLTFRPSFTPAWSRASQQTHIALSRLTSSQIVRMVKERTGRDRLPPGIADWIVERTDGVPLFVEEVTNLVVESGALEELSDSSMSTGAVPLHAIPDSLQDLMMARLNRIGGDRTVIQLAAVLGREFSFDLIRAASTIDEETLEAELDTLVEAELLYRKGRSSERRYIFKHALIQDAAYDSILKSARRDMHASIVDALLAEFPGIEQAEPELLAQHCTQAGMAERAIGYWLAAGERAMGESALEEAISHFSSGLELVARQEPSEERDSLELSFQIPLAVTTLYARGYASPDVLRVQERARALCERLSHPALYYIVWGIHACRLVRAEYDVAEQLGAELMELADATPEGAFTIEAFHNVATPALYQGNFDTCRQASEDGFDLYDPATSAAHAQHTGQNSGVTNLCYWALGLWYCGDTGGALQRAREAVELALDLKHGFSIAYAHHHTGWLYFNCRMAAEAEAAGRAAIEIARAQGLGLWDATGALYAAGGLLLAGDNEAAFELASEGLAGYQATGASLGTSLYRCFMAEALACMGRYNEALERIDAALEFIEAHNERFHEAEANRLKGEILRRAGAAPEEAEVWLRRALEIARAQAAPPLIARAEASLNR